MHSSSTTGSSSRILGKEFGGKGYFSLLGFMGLCIAWIWIGQGKVVLPKNEYSDSLQKKKTHKNDLIASVIFEKFFFYFLPV